MPKKPLNKKTINKIISLHKNENLSCIKIGERLGISQNTANKYLRRSGYDVARISPLVIPIDDVNKMRRLKQQGYTLKEISEKLRYAVPTISFYTSEKEPRVQNWNRKKIIKLLSNNDFSCAKAAKKINRKKSNVSFLVRKYGLSQFVKNGRENLKNQRDIESLRKVIDLHNKGFNVLEIAKISHKSTPFILITLRHHQNSNQTYCKS